MKKGISLLIVGGVYAQIGGGWSYDFIRIAATARTAALGSIAFPGKPDLGAAFQNPALLSARHTHTFQISLHPYLADIVVGSLAYGHEWRGVGTLWTGLQYIDYGEFRHADEVGNILGVFRAYEGFIAGGAARHFGKWHAGMNLKFPFSVISLQSYRRAGVAADIGVLYEDTVRGWGISLLLRDLGTELYRSGGRPFAQPFPTSLQGSVSYKVPHAPFRLHLALIHLQRWRMAYNDPMQPTRYDLSGNPMPPPPPKWTEHLFRHFVLGLELLPDKIISFRFAYNVQRRRELNPIGSSSFGGMSFGTALQARRWGLEYAYSIFFRRMGVHSFSLTVRPFKQLP
ncbi:MAG: type IX secretion system protein PorQ [Bacteroidia bacterium]|nr:type IX secretion system protein PorQ [Bacteroidia bacterium]MDW8133483.1 type IX secretion system protein PorQ [Bacteroidia bacterium]